MRYSFSVTRFGTAASCSLERAGNRSRQDESLSRPTSALVARRRRAGDWSTKRKFNAKAQPMKTHLTLKTVSAGLITGLLATIVLTAADPRPDATPRPAAPADRQPGGPGGAGGFGGRGDAGGGPGRIFRGATLTDAQRELLREAWQTHGDEMRKLAERLRTAEKELMQAILAEKQDEKGVREKADAVAKLQTEQTLLLAKLFAPIVPTLTAEQRTQFEESPMALRMLGGGLGGGAGMRGGGGRQPRGN
jgi:Spy/CpxP family protein refolding chaperone